LIRPHPGSPGETLAGRLQEPSPAVIRLSQTIPETSAIPSPSVVQIVGSMLATYELSPELCSSNIGARCLNLHAPALVSRAAVRELILTEPAIVEQLRIIAACTRVVYSVAGVEPGTTVLHTGLRQCRRDRCIREERRGRGRCGALHRSRQRQVPGFSTSGSSGIPLQDLKRISERLCVAGGPQKTTIIRATLVGGYATTLVTDERTARALMAESKPRARR
jgi:dihydroxyacetone kinase-like protein